MARLGSQINLFLKMLMHIILSQRNFDGRLGRLDQSFPMAFQWLAYSFPREFGWQAVSNPAKRFMQRQYWECEQEALRTKIEQNIVWKFTSNKTCSTTAGETRPNKIAFEQNNRKKNNLEQHAIVHKKSRTCSTSIAEQPRRTRRTERVMLHLYNTTWSVYRVIANTCCRTWDAQKKQCSVSHQL